MISSPARIPGPQDQDDPCYTIRNYSCYHLLSLENQFPNPKPARQFKGHKGKEVWPEAAAQSVIKHSGVFNSWKRKS